MNNTVEVRVIVPRDAVRPVPVVILLHYWGARNVSVEERIAKRLNAFGIASAILTLPYHMSRSPPGVLSGELAMKADTAHLRLVVTQAVWDVRRLIDWIEEQSELDASRIAVAGTSVGAVIGSLVYSVDERVGSAALLLPGGDLAHQIWTSSVLVPIRLEFRRQGYTLERLREELASVEPLNYATPDLGNDVLIVAAKFDEVVPPEDARKLIAAYGEPQSIWLDTGHYGGALIEWRLNRLVAEYMHAKFSGQPFNPPGSLGELTIRIGIQYNPDYKLTLAAGVDLWRSGRPLNLFVTGLATTEGFLIFAGRPFGRGFSAGVTLTQRRATWGIFWGFVL